MGSAEITRDLAGSRGWAQSSLGIRVETAPRFGAGLLLPRAAAATEFCPLLLLLTGGELSRAATELRLFQHLPSWGGTLSICLDASREARIHSAANASQLPGLSPACLPSPFEVIHILPLASKGNKICLAK